jgi:Ca2+-binding EF-hand superfamily protein
VAEEILMQIDQDGDGNLSFDEFSFLMRNLSQ